MINKFDGNYDFLSNFYPVAITFAGITYPSVENAFQAMKTLNFNERLEFVNLTPNEAKHKGRRIVLRAKWDNIKPAIMLTLIRIKFENLELREKLLATGDEELIEGNYWNDTFWGVCNGIGKNYLGKILMRVREEIKNGSKF